METPHYLRFVRALAFVAGAGCSDNATTPPGADAAPDLNTPDASPDVGPDVGLDVGPDANPDVGPDVGPDVAVDARPDVSPLDVAVDARPDVGPDVPSDAPPDVSPMRDVAADDGGVTPDGSTSPDVVADANPCPATAPRSGEACPTPMLSCRYDMSGGGFTSCFCMDMGALRQWSCATAVPGPLPPPEFVA